MGRTMSQEVLFDMQGAERGSRPRRAKWGGSKSTEARKRIRAMLPAPCWRCGTIINPDDPESSWHAGHEQDRHETEALGLPEAETLPECAKCNLSAGGKAGAAITNRSTPGAQAATVTHEQREREPQWW